MVRADTNQGLTQVYNYINIWLSFAKQFSFLTFEIEDPFFKARAELRIHTILQL